MGYQIRSSDSSKPYKRNKFIKQVCEANNVSAKIVIDKISHRVPILAWAICEIINEDKKVLQMVEGLAMQDNNAELELISDIGQFVEYVKA